MKFSKDNSKKNTVYCYFEIVTNAGPLHNLDFGSIHKDRAWNSSLFEGGYVLVYSAKLFVFFFYPELNSEHSDWEDCV